MWARLLLGVVALLPLAAQDDVDKYLTERRAEAARTPSIAKTRADLESDTLFQVFQRSLQTETSPSNRASLYSRLADLLAGVGATGEELEMRRQAVELSPKSAVYAANLAGTLMTLGRPEEAAKVLGADWYDAAALLAKSRTVYGGALALQLALRAQELRPFDRETAAWLADLYMRNGRPGKAIEALRKLIADAPAECSDHRRLALVFYHEQSMADARTEFQAALACSTSDADREETQGLLGNIKERTGK